MGSDDPSEPRLEHLVFKVAQGLAGEPGPPFFDALVRNLAQALPADFVFAGEFQPERKRIVALASFGDAPQPPREFGLAETPFEHLTPERTGPVSYPVGAAAHFPNDPILRTVPGDGYVTAPLVDSAGNLLGLMSAVTHRRLEDAKVAEEVVRIYSALAVRQLERLKQIKSLERQNAEFRRAAGASENRAVPGAGATREAGTAQGHVPAHQGGLTQEPGAVLKAPPEREGADFLDESRITYPAGIGNSPEFRALLNHLRRVAPASGVVLIQGEPGSGKELAARTIHSLSSRRMRPLVKLDCAAIAPELLERELFGGMSDSRPEVSRAGRLELAEGGTLLIGEIAAMPLELQSKLLRVILQREFRPLGFTRTVKTDVRLLVTTNRDLEAEVKQERFRSDLYQRVSPDSVQVPPLRRRRLDIPLLVRRYTAMLERRLGRTGLRVSERMMAQMMTYSWPGNIRELEDVLFRGALNGMAELDAPVQPATAASGVEPTTLRDAERHHVTRILSASNWVIEGPRGAAAALKVPPSTLRSLMKRLNIQRAAKAPEQS